MLLPERPLWKLEVRALANRLRSPLANQNIDCPPQKKLKIENYWTRCWKWMLFWSRFHFTGDGAGASDGRKADKTRERLVFTGRVQGCGADVKFLSKQPFSIRMNYICRERHVGGIADRAAKKKEKKKKTPAKKPPRPPSETCISSSVVACLIGTLMDAFLTSVTGRRSARCDVDIWSEGCVVVNRHN